MSKTIKLKKGWDINLKGKAAEKLVDSVQCDVYAIKPDNFVGISRPKLMVTEGDVVKAGTPILFDKQLEKVLYTAPVSGEVVEVKRGAKRKLLEVRILADKSIDFEQHRKFTTSEISSLSNEEAKAHMLKSGVWPNLLQRPYSIVADPDIEPKSIFISAFDTAPLAPNYDFIFKGCEKYFQEGVNILKKLTKGAVNINVDGDGEISSVFANIQNAELNKVAGPHPAGNVGVQIHHIDPINKGDVVWTVNPYGVIQIGKLFMEGVYDASKIIAVTGSAFKTPQYYKTHSGAHLSKILDGGIEEKTSTRVISGNVLTGEAVGSDGFLGFYDNQVTIIPEGDKPRFFLTDGWLAPTSRLSFHRALGLLSFLSPKKEHALDSSMNGEERAFVMTSAFEQVLPMDILPTQLIKAIMAKDYDEMEALGIYEVAEEDMALCEFIDVSKHPVQEIIREGLDLMREG